MTRRGLRAVFVGTGAFMLATSLVAAGLGFSGAVFLAVIGSALLAAREMV